ncbi:MAG: sulfurtransferase-like selenium metabolism protein YedF [Tissierellia bacterium]|nr:sulfurtransferase-like selenium metabolism protein YedF [Tissierellia bacterium]
MKTIDAMGLACPQPVIITKQEIRLYPEEEILVLVDNELATENLSKMAHQLGYKPRILKKEEGKYEVHLKKIQEMTKKEGKIETSKYIVVFDSDIMGDGDPGFSKTLLEGFTYALTEQDHLPEKIICYNRGIFLTTENKKTIQDFQTLEKKGVEILSCGLCLDYYHKKDDLAVGEGTNMYRILELMNSHHVVKP